MSILSNNGNEAHARTGDVLVSDSAGIRTIRLNRPEKKNAITSAMYVEMTDALSDPSTNDAIRCTMLAGTASSFSAGNDIDDFVQMCRAGKGLSPEARNFLRAIALCEKPIVAAVSGIAIGVGATMLLHCDYVIASDDAKLSAPFVKLGIIPEAGSTLILPTAIGHARAFEFLIMGRTLRAQEALRIGIINEVASPDDVDTRARSVATEIAALPSASVSAARNLLRGPRKSVLARIEQEIELIDKFLGVREVRQIFEAFVSQKA